MGLIAFGRAIASQPALYPQLSFVADTPPEINNFPLLPTPPPTPQARFSMFTSSSTPPRPTRKLSKRAQPLPIRPSHVHAPPPSSFRPPPSSFGWLRRKSGRFSYGSEYHGDSDAPELPSRNCVSDLGHGTDSSLSVSDMQPHRHLSSKFSRQKLRKVSTRIGPRLSQSEHGHGSPDYTSVESYPAWNHGEYSSPSSGSELDPFAHPPHPYSSECSSSCSSDFYAVRPPLLREDVAPSHPCISPTAPSYPPALTCASPDTSRRSEPSTSSSDTSTSLTFRSNLPEELPPQPPPKSPSYAQHFPLYIPIKPHRRWTIAMAMSDESVSDEMLVEALEEMRRTEGTPGVLGATCVWGVDRYCQGNDSSSNPVIKPIVKNKSSPDFSHATSLHSSIFSDKIGSKSSPWPTARRALLAVRELIRTEKRYISALKTLLAAGQSTEVQYSASADDLNFCRPKTRGGDFTISHLPASSVRGPPPPPLMTSYARVLVDVGQMLLDLFEGDMSVDGVARAFIEVMSSNVFDEVPHDDLVFAGTQTGESAFVSWCSVVGTWFTGNVDEEMKRKPRKLSRASMSLAKRRYTTGDTSSPMSSTPALSESGPVSESSLTRLSVRDIAIMPTQRIMRYVLLFHDLLAHTPLSSPARETVKNATDTAVALARKCDCAQGNAAFLM